MKIFYLLFILALSSYTCIAQPPWVHFVADHTTPTPELTVTFTDLSWFEPNAWEWVFTPNTVTYIEGTQFSQNPKVRFNEYTKYTVQLTATNSFGSGIEIKEDYVKVRPEYEIGLNEDGASGYINVQVRVNSGDLPSITKKIQDIEFGIMWNKLIVSGNKLDLDLACVDVNPYHLEQKGNPVPHNHGGNGGWDYRNFGLINGTNQFEPPETWTYGQWMTIMQLQVYRRTPGGDPLPQGQFLIVPSTDHFNKAVDPIMKVGSIVHLLDTLPDSHDMYNPFFDIPTNLHGYRWAGGNGSDGFDDYSWNHGPNWTNGCGEEGTPATIPPGIYDDCIIPNIDTDKGGSGCYPRYTRQTNPTELIAVGQDISVVDGGRIEWMNTLSSTERVLLQTQGYLKIDETSNVSIYSDGLIEVGGDSIGWIAPLKIIGDTGLRVKSGGWLNTKYTTSIEGDSALIIEADEFGVGSFINEGAITYSGGTAKVETFVTGEVGDYYMHFVGPTVEDTATGYNNSVRLQQFDMTTLDTYAFEWDPTVDTNTGQPWINVWPFPYEVPLGNGLTLSNYEAGEGTIGMVGKINDETITYYGQSFTNNNLELISNPYSSAIDFLEFASDNSTVIFTKYYIYDASTGNWITWAGAAGDQQYLQVGQGFFVIMRQSGNITFNNSLRVHSTDPFREINPNLLALKVTGGSLGFTDELSIQFHPDATIDYDEEMDAIKWNSYSSGATMIRSIAEDGTELAINTMPLVDMNSTLTSIPVHFECGEDAQYIFAFKGLDSFDFGTEVWLEDKLNGSNWFSLVNNEEEYSFLAAPGDQKDRFVIHFFGPTYIPEDIDNKSNPIKIYTSGNNAYVVNNSDEKIKEITIYNMLGQEVVKVKVHAQNIHKLEVKGQTGYYAIRVLTDKNLYSEKVFIKRN